LTEWIRHGIVFAVLLSFVGCSDSERRRRRDNADEEGGGAGEAGASNTGGSAGSRGGSAGKAGASGGDTSDGGDTAAGGDSGAAGGSGGSSASGGTAGQGGGGGTLSGGSAGMEQCTGTECSGNGTCVDGADGPRCDCDAGYAPFGLECRACPSVSGTFDIDVPRVTVSGAISVNGSPLPSSPSAQITFVTSQGDWVRSDTLDTPSYAAPMIPGTYDVIYEAQANVPGAPRNSSVKLLEGLTFDADETLDLDIPMVVVTGNITVNGEPVRTLDAYVYLMQSPAEAAALGDLSTGTYSAEVVPGTYDVRYSGFGQNSLVPVNQATLVDANVTIDADGVLDIDIPMVSLSGNITVNGEPITTSANAPIYFVSSEYDYVPVANVNQSSYAINLIPGTYDVVYTASTQGEGVPDNLYARFLEGVTIDRDGTLDLDVPMAVISGSISVNGAPVVATNTDVKLHFVNDAGWWVTAADVNQGTYSVEIIPGTYDVLYSSQPADDGLPDNVHAILGQRVRLDSTQTFDIDIPMTVVTGDVAVNGAPVSTTGAASFYFASPGEPLTSDADFVVAASLTDLSYSAEVVPGTYDVRYVAVTPAAGIPSNSGALVLESVALDSPQNLDLDVPMVPLSGNITLNGGAVATAGIGELAFLGELGDYTILGNVGDGSYSSRLVPGTYNLNYSVRLSDPSIPNNLIANFGCVQVE
jgi:hypothetical protein